jgi:hypothetical protein
MIVPLILTVAPVSATSQEAIPTAVTFAGAVPNPFNPITDLLFALPAETSVSLDLFDVSGRRIRNLLSGRLPAGDHAVPWNGCDDAGRPVASGTYFARLTTDGAYQVKSVTLVR